MADVQTNKENNQQFSQKNKDDKGLLYHSWQYYSIDV
jgi:hypothetical protein